MFCTNINFILQPNQPERVVLEKWLAEDIELAMEEAWCSGKDDFFEKLLHMLRSQNVTLDYQVSRTSLVCGVPY
jgi:hypothetical protein